MRCILNGEYTVPYTRQAIKEIIMLIHFTEESVVCAELKWKIERKEAKI